MTITTSDESLIAMYGPASAAKHLALLHEKVDKFAKLDEQFTDIIPKYGDDEPWSDEDNAIADSQIDALYDLAFFVVAHVEQLRFSNNSEDWT